MAGCLIFRGGLKLQGQNVGENAGIGAAGTSGGAGGLAGGKRKGQKKSRSEADGKIRIELSFGLRVIGICKN